MFFDRYLLREFFTTMGVSWSEKSRPRSGVERATATEHLIVYEIDAVFLQGERLVFSLYEDDEAELFRRAIKAVLARLLSRNPDLSSENRAKLHQLLLEHQAE